VPPGDRRLISGLGIMLPPEMLEVAQKRAERLGLPVTLRGYGAHLLTAWHPYSCYFGGRIARLRETDDNLTASHQVPRVEEEKEDAGVIEARRRPVRARDVMTRDIETVTPDMTLDHVASRMRKHDIGALPVVEGGRLVGILTAGDITLRATARGLLMNEATVAEVMTKGVVCCLDEDYVQDAVKLMGEKEIRRLVVLDQSGRLAGILVLADTVSQID
jgi:CBS domain-containing protein